MATSPPDGNKGDCLADLDADGLEAEFPQAEIAMMLAERQQEERREVSKRAILMASGLPRGAPIADPLVGKRAVFGHILAGLAPGEGLSWWTRPLPPDHRRVDIYLSIEVEVPGSPVKAIVGAALIESRNWPLPEKWQVAERPGLREHCAGLVERYRDVKFLRRLLYMIEHKGAANT